MVILQNNRSKIKIGSEAFKVLEKLLNSYPIKAKIPIDIYVYTNKVYADLESVDLSKVERYEEVIKEMEIIGEN